MVLKLLPAVTLASRALRGMSPVDQMRTNNNKQLISLAAEGNTCCSDMSHIRGEQHSLVSVPLSCYITFNNCKSNDVGVPQRQMYSYLNIHHLVIFRGHLANRSVNQFIFFNNFVIIDLSRIFVRKKNIWLILRGRFVSVEFHIT